MEVMGKRLEEELALQATSFEAKCISLKVRCGIPSLKDNISTCRFSRVLCCKCHAYDDNDKKCPRLPTHAFDEGEEREYGIPWAAWSKI